MRIHHFFSLCLSLLLLAGCTETQLASHVVKNLPHGGSQSQGTFKVGKPYQINGKWYTPKETYSHTETGIASWYGSQFHGKRTANGEIFDMNELTAAHRTLQLPSLVRVTNLENGRSLIVRVNDRGPFKRGRIIDLSKRSAELLGFKNQGTARVKLQVMTQESLKIAEAAKRGEDTRGTEVAANENRLLTKQPTTRTASAAPREPITQAPQPTYQQAAARPPVESEPLNSPVEGHIKNGNFLPDEVVKQVPVAPTNMYVQAGSFGEQANAIRLAQTLQNYGNAQVYPADINGTRFYRVRIGPMPSVNNADRVLETLANAGHSQAIIVVE